MNKTFKSIWNEALGAWVAASELDRARGKRVASSRGTPERDIEGAAAVRAGATSAPSLRRLAMLMASAYLALFHAGAHAQYNPDGGTATGGVSSIAIGVGSSAAQTNSTALGNLSTAQGVSAGLGPGRMRWATLTAVGINAQATGVNSTSMGVQAIGSGDYSVSIGNLSSATQSGSVAMGSGAAATGVSAIGNRQQCAGFRSIRGGAGPRGERRRRRKASRWAMHRMRT